MEKNYAISEKLLYLISEAICSFIKKNANYNLDADLDFELWMFVNRMIKQYLDEQDVEIIDSKPETYEKTGKK